MSNETSNNKRIAKNTLFMYFRMFITMAAGLYTARVVLKALGAEDYGLYNVIGGIISMFTFINGAMTNTTSRYITFYLGKKDAEGLNNIFSMSFLIHAFIALIIILLGETIGLWYLYEKLVIPEGRLSVAVILYQLSIASAVVNILYVPFNATIVAHEKMSAFAYISIMDAVLKLSIALSINYVPIDKLIYYGIMLFLIPLVDISIYYTYCKRNFEETNIRWYWSKPLFKEMFSFTGWSVLGNFSYVFFNQGINLILNSFCGTAVNAARGVAMQVDALVRQFAANVQIAINPQIIKSYADNDMRRMYTLIFSSSRLCYFLLLLLALPIILEADVILQVWLGEVPPHTINFVRIVLVGVILDTLVNPMFTANLATGKVKIYQIWISIISYGFMPLVYLSIKLTDIPESVFLCTILCNIICVVARVYILRKQIDLSVTAYIKEVIMPIMFVSGLSLIAPLYVHGKIENMVLDFFTTCAVSVLSVIVFVWILGMKHDERKFVLKKIHLSK